MYLHCENRTYRHRCMKAVVPSQARASNDQVNLGQDPLMFHVIGLSIESKPHMSNMELQRLTVPMDFTRYCGMIGQGSLTASTMLRCTGEFHRRVLTNEEGMNRSRIT